MKRGSKVLSALTLALTLSATSALAAPSPAAGAAAIVPPNATAYGKSLSEWVGTYFRWYQTGADPAQSLVDGGQLIPLPAGTYISGAGTPEDPALYQGQLELTLRAGTPFVLAAYGWVGERYQDYPNTPDDVPVADAVMLAGVHPQLTIDGITVLSETNKVLYYATPIFYTPVAAYPAATGYGSVAAVFVQGGAVVGHPLPVGRHVIKLYEPFCLGLDAYPDLPGWGGFGVIYDNTWIINVVPAAQGRQ